jgi:ketosteroid isomerase-like protein
MSNQDPDVFDWLDTWQSLINSGDFGTARPLFSPDVVAFGTVTGFMRSLPVLEERQWRQVWGKIKEFTFEKETAVVFRNGSSDLVTVACLWHSLGRTRSSWYERRGRVTLVLRSSDQGLQCLHSHFSMEPGIPPLGDEL